MKIKLKGAQKGHSLLKRKSDALTARFRTILQRIRDAKVAMGATMKGAAFALAEVNFAAGDISFAVREGVSGSATTQVRSRMENVSGVQLPVFEAVYLGLDGRQVGGERRGADGADDGSREGKAPDAALASAASSGSLRAASPSGSSWQWLGRGGQQVVRCREAYGRALGALIELAALQTSFFILDDVIKATNRRVNALEHVLLPKVDATVSYITSELDEHDREDFFRLKKIQANKRRGEDDAAAEGLLHPADAAEGPRLDEDTVRMANLLLECDDADVFI